MVTRGGLLDVSVILHGGNFDVCVNVKQTRTSANRTAGHSCDTDEKRACVQCEGRFIWTVSTSKQLALTSEF